MLQELFKDHLKQIDESLSKREINNLQRANKALLVRLSKCFDTFIKYNVGVDYYVPIYGNNFNIDNKIRSKTLAILKQENIIQVKTNSEGRESYQCSFTKAQKRLDVNNPTPKSYCFTEYGFSLVQNKQFVQQITSLLPVKPSKYSSPEEFEDQILKKAAEDNLSLNFKLNKPLQVVVEEYLEAVKEDWNVNQRNYKHKYKEAQQVVLNTINNFNNKLLKFKERMYTALSLCPKELRQYFTTPEGQKIDEAFDINSSIFTLLGDTLELYAKEKQLTLPPKFYEEKKWLKKKCFSKTKHIYNYIGGKKYSKEQIKPHVMQVVFSNNEDMQSRDENKSVRNYIKDFIQKRLPTMWELLIHFEQEENEDYQKEMQKYNQFVDSISLYNAGLIQFKPKHVAKPKQIKSSFWRYFQRVETHYMLQLKHRLETKLNTTCYWIHDCLCLNQSLITDKLKTLIKDQFKVLLNSNQQLLKSNQKVSSAIQGRREKRESEYLKLKNEIDIKIDNKVIKEIKHEKTI